MWLNKLQKKVLYAYIGAIALIMIFPPFSYTYSNTSTTASVGYSLFFFPPEGSGDFRYLSEVNTDLLLLELIAASLIAGAALVALQSEI